MRIALLVLLVYVILSVIGSGLLLWAVTRPRKTWRED